MFAVQEACYLLQSKQTCNLNLITLKGTYAVIYMNFFLRQANEFIYMT